MRNYSRVYHTSLDYLKEMSISRLMAELEDAAEDLAEENRQQQRRLKEMKSTSKRNSRPKRRR